MGGGTTQTKIQKSTSKSQDHLQQNKTKGQVQQTTCQRSFPEDFDLSKINLESNTTIEKTNRLGGLYDKKGEKNKSLKETLEKTELENVKDVAYLDTYNRNAITDGTAKTILTGVDFRNHDFLLIKNATTKGFLEAEDGDGVDISKRMEHHRGTVQKGKSQTLTTAGGANVGVVIKEDCPKVEKIGNYSPSGHNASSIVDVGGVAPTVMENHGTITAVMVNEKRKG